MHRSPRRTFIGIAMALASWAGLAKAAEAADIVSGETKAGQLASPSYTQTWDFQADAPDTHVVITTSEQAFGVQPEIFLYYIDPDVGLVFEDARTGTSLSQRLDRTLAHTGSYRIIVQDNGQNSAGNYSIALALIPGEATSASDSDGGPIASGASVTGTFDYQADTDLFTFSGEKDDRVLITLADLGFNCRPEIYLYPPSGAGFEASKTGTANSKELEVRLAESGTYTILVQPNALNLEGQYALSFLKIPGETTADSDTDGGPLLSGETKTGLLSPTTDTDAFTFDATAGDRVILTTADFTTNTQTEIYVYPPGGGDPEATSLGAFTSHRVDLQVAATGTYTVVVRDSGLNGSGYYAISLVQLPGAATSETDTDGGPITPGTTGVGRLLNRADTDVWQFWGEAGARVVVATGDLAGGVQPEIWLYPSDGGALVASDLGAATRHKVDAQLPAAGLYSIVVSDYQNRHDDGYYAITLAVLPGPLTSPDDRDGGPIDFDRSVRGSFSGPGDMDCWQFYGTVGDQVTITASRASTNGGVVEPDIFLYPPDHGPVEASATGGGATRRLIWQLKQSGLFTVMLSDSQRTNAGAYDLIVGKSPPTLAPGIYNQFPPLGATLSDLSESLRWGAVPGATSYDVRFGDDLLDRLPLIGEGLAAPSAAIPGDVTVDGLYYWQVIAHTPAGDVEGPVLWFKTSFAPIIAADDFSDGDVTGDKNWAVVSGVWRVNDAKQYYSTPLVTPYIQDNRAVYLPIGNFVVGEFSSRVALTKSVVRGKTKPNAELTFAFNDAFHYRYVRLLPGKIQIGQSGGFAGDDDTSKVSKRAKVPSKGSFDVRVVVLSDGQVDVYLKKVKKKRATEYPATPTATFKFKGTSPGYVGYRALGAKSLFDDFAAVVRALVQ